MNPPNDYNPHTHRRPPSSRVELLAWRCRQHDEPRLRRLANVILVNAGITCAYHDIRAEQKPFRRNMIALCAVRIRSISQTK